MNGLKISFAVVAFVLIQGVAVIWYVSKLDSRVDQMYKSFEEENRMAGPKQKKKLKPRRKIPEMEFGGAKVGVYMKPLDTKSKKNNKIKPKNPRKRIKK